MTKERCLELLNQVIDHVSATQNTQRTIHELLLIGFTPKELTETFRFDTEDVNEAIAAEETCE